MPEYLWLLIGLMVLGTLGSALIMGQLARQRSRVQTQLSASEERMSLAVNAAGLGLWDWDIAGGEIWATDECLALYGFAPGMSVGLPKFLMTVHPDDRESTYQAIQRTLKDQTDFHQEYRVVLPNNGLRWIAARGRVYFDAQGKPWRMMGVSIDITARKEAALEAHRERQILAHTARAATLGELSAALAHELNQPLTSILSNAQAGRRFLAKTPPDLGELSGLLKDIAEASQRAGEVVQRLRILFKKGETPRRPLDINVLAQEVAQLLHCELLAKQASLQMDLADGLPEIVGDAVQLQQVLMNLLMNGAEAMASLPGAPRMLRLSTRRSEAGGGVEIEVCDSGPGLSPEALQACFEPFFTTKPDGLGMGLSISRSIIRAHGGRLWVANHPGGGAVFRITLPLEP